MQHDQSPKVIGISAKVGVEDDRYLGRKKGLSPKQSNPSKREDRFMAAFFLKDILSLAFSK